MCTVALLSSFLPFLLPSLTLSFPRISEEGHPVDPIDQLCIIWELEVATQAGLDTHGEDRLKHVLGCGV